MNGAAVRVETEMVTLNDGREVPSRFVVIGQSGYRAEFRACLRDDCLGGHVLPCLKPNGHIETVDAWLRHCRTHCHGWHVESAEAFAAKVAKTYGERWRPRQGALPGFTAYMRRANEIGHRVIAPCPAWPVIEVKPQPEPCDCESCRATLARFGAAR